MQLTPTCKAITHRPCRSTPLESTQFIPRSCSATQQEQQQQQSHHLQPLTPSFHLMDLHLCSACTNTASEAAPSP